MPKSRDKIKQYTRRLTPDEDLRTEIEAMVRKNKIRAGCVLSVVGSLKKVELRMAGGRIVKVWNAPSEIVSGTGTVSQDGCHIHIAIADKNGKVIGGHLKEGCVVRTTVEVVLLEFKDARYRRVLDKKTGFDELSLN